MKYLLTIATFGFIATPPAFAGGGGFERNCRVANEAALRSDIRSGSLSSIQGSLQNMICDEGSAVELKTTQAQITVSTSDLLQFSSIFKDPSSLPAEIQLQVAFTGDDGLPVISGQTKLYLRGDAYLTTFISNGDVVEALRQGKRLVVVVSALGGYVAGSTVLSKVPGSFL